MEVESLGFWKILEEIVNALVIDLEKGTVDTEALVLLLLKKLNVFKKGEYCPGNHAGIILIRNKVLKECILMLLLLNMFVDSVLPVAPEHSISFA